MVKTQGESNNRRVFTAQPTKSIVRVGTDKGWLRLRWTYQGRRYALTLGLPDSAANRLYAEQKAKVVELDIISGNFDLSLKKYKTQGAIKRSQLSITSLLEKFWTDRGKTLSSRTIENYRAAIRYLKQFIDLERGEPTVQAVNAAMAERFTEWLKNQKLMDITCKTYLTLIKAIWNWGIQKGLVEENPWQGMTLKIKVTPKQMSTPFTKEEIASIIQAFRTDRYYHSYADFVEFLFGTGCRTGEAIGLQWKHLTDDCSIVWIGESYSRGVRKSTKTNRSRTITLTPRLQEILLVRRSKNFDPDGLVFTAPKGGAIDDHNFRNRAWKTILSRLGIDYRKPYLTRHTLISHALDIGMNPVNVAQLTGHDVQTLYEHYAGVVSSRPRLPELLDSINPTK